MTDQVLADLPPSQEWQFQIPTLSAYIGRPNVGRSTPQQGAAVSQFPTLRAHI